MSHYSIAIRSTDPGSAWIIAFEQELVRKGIRPEYVAYFVKFYQEHQSYEQAKKQLAEAEREAGLILELLLHPRHHKHYLRDIAQLDEALRTNPRVVVVYDDSEIEETNADKSIPVTKMEITCLVDHLRFRYGDHRIVDRETALNGIKERFSCME